MVPIISFSSLLAAYLVAWASSASAQTCQPSGIFGPQQVYPAGESAQGLALADIDADGDLDAIVANAATNSVSVLTNDGLGRFVVTQTPDTGIWPRHVAVADIGGDGDLDIITASSVLQDVWVLTNQNGVFGQRRRLGIRENTSDVAAANLFGSSAAEILVPLADTQAVALYRGLTREALIPVGGWPSSIALADFDANGTIDMGVIEQSGEHTAVLFLHDGDGGFERVSELRLGRSTLDLAFADLSGNGVLDLLATTSRGDELVVAEGLGDGHFVERERYSTGTVPYSIAIGDVDDDGDADVVVGNQADDAIQLMLNDGTGGLAAQAVYPMGENVWQVQLADVNGDRRLDVLCSNSADGTLVVRLNRCGPCRVDLDGDGTLTVTDFLAFQNLFADGDPTADFDRDGSLTVFDYLAFFNEFEDGC